MKLHTETTIDPASGKEAAVYYLVSDDGSRQFLAQTARRLTASRLSWPVIAKLVAGGVTGPEAARAMSDEELLALPGIGKVALREIREALA